MKDFLLFFLITCYSTAIYAQVEKPRNRVYSDYKRFHFGFTLGAHSQDLAIARNENTGIFADVSDPGIGFQVMAITDLMLAENWDLRFLPGIVLGEKPLSYYDLNTRELIKTQIIESNYIDFPVLIKFSSKRLNNIRPYLIGGANYRFDLAANKDQREENMSPVIKLKPSDFYLESGFGIDLYFPYARISPEIKVGIGLRNLMENIDPDNTPGNLSGSIEKLQSFIVMINLHLQD